MLGLLIAACFAEDPFVVTDYAYPAFVITERADAARAHAEPPKVEPAEEPVYEFVMYTASWCGPCQEWKRSVMPSVKAAGIEPKLIDITQNRGTGVSRIPEFRVLKKQGGRTEIVRTWIGYVSLSSIQAAMPRPAVSKPARSPGLFGRVGTSHESRATLIDHLMEDGIHSGRHTRGQLEKMSDEDLNDLHTREHEAAGHVVDNRGLWKS